jgi:small GTP-binding protein
MSKTVAVTADGKPDTVNLVIWDILGQHAYTRLQKKTVEGSSGIIFVGDISRRETLISIRDHWLPQIADIVPRTARIIFVNKVDLPMEMQIPEEEMGAIAESLNADAFLTSAKTGENVEEGFSEFAQMTLTADSTTIKQAIEEPKDIKELYDAVCAEFMDALPDNRKAEGSELIRKNARLANMDIEYPAMDQMYRFILQLASDVPQSADPTECKKRWFAWAKRIDR